MILQGWNINVLFNDALNTFYLRLYGVGHMSNDNSENERGNPLPLNIVDKEETNTCLFQLGIWSIVKTIFH